MSNNLRIQAASDGPKRNMPYVCASKDHAAIQECGARHAAMEDPLAGSTAYPDW